MLWRSCVLRVGVIGINFKTAELSLREAIAKSAQNLAGERSLFFPHPTVLLSTCNRTEIYFSGHDLAQVQSDLLSLLRKQVAILFEHRLYSYFGIDCFVHLCRVTSGLDSAIIGETEIQRQVKTAYSRASEVLSLPGCLHYLFQKSLKVAKSVRGRLALEKGSSTLFGTLWHLAEQALGDLKEKRVLLVGYSTIHRGFSSYLEQRGVKKITFATRWPEKAQPAHALGREELQNWHAYDLISCASIADHFLIRGQGKKGHLIFDLSVPRNVDPEVETAGVLLYNIEQINRMIEQASSIPIDCLERLEGYLWTQVLLLSKLYRKKMDRANICS